MFMARALAAVFSEVKLFVREFPVSVREQGTNLYIGKYGFSLVHPNVQPPLHSQSPYANRNGNADSCYVCGDWLVCQTISV